MTHTTILALLFGVTLYLLVGMVLAHHTSLGSKYYPTSPVRLTFFWIVPIVGVVFWFFGVFVAEFLGDGILFGDKNGDPGISKLLE